MVCGKGSNHYVISIMKDCQLKKKNGFREILKIIFKKETGLDFTLNFIQYSF